MKKSTYKDKSRQELIKSLGEKRETLRKVRFGSTGSKVRNVKKTSNVKKDIARIMTELNVIQRSNLNKK